MCLPFSNSNKIPRLSTNKQSRHLIHSFAFLLNSRPVLVGRSVSASPCRKTNMSTPISQSACNLSKRCASSRLVVRGQQAARQAPDFWMTSRHARRSHTHLNTHKTRRRNERSLATVLFVFLVAGLAAGTRPRSQEAQASDDSSRL